MLISFQQVTFSYKDVPILSNVEFSLHENERVGLIGGNGEGKTTLLRILLGELSPDAGSVFRKNGLKIGYLEQSGGLESIATVYSAMEEVFEEDQRLVAKLEAAQCKIGEADENEQRILASEIESLTKRITARDSYHFDVKIRTCSTEWDSKTITISPSPPCRAEKRPA